MGQKYYNGDQQVNKEEFEQERARIIAQRIKDAEDEDNLIKDEDLDFYLDELQKMEE